MYDPTGPPPLFFRYAGLGASFDTYTVALDAAAWIDLADLTGDGHDDVLLVRTTGSLVWYRSPGAPQSGWDVVDTQLTGVTVAWGADRNADTDIDLVYASDAVLELGVWYHPWSTVPSRVCADGLQCDDGATATSGCVRQLDDRTAVDVCQPCGVLSGETCGGSEFLQGCGPYHTGQCVPCSTTACLSGTSETAACSATSDRQCTACCGTFQWGSTCPGPCQACSAAACAPGELLTGCAGLSPGACEACQPPSAACPGWLFPVTSCGGGGGLQPWQCDIPGMAIDTSSRISLAQRAAGAAGDGLAVGDVDQDGFTDVVATDNAANAVYLWRSDGVNGFLARTVLTNTIVRPWSIVLQDFNNDAFPDVVCSTSTPQFQDSIVWLANRGDGTFGVRVPLASLQGPIHLRHADMDHDGNLDVLFVAATDDAMGWMKSTGTGRFTPPIIVTRAGNVPFSVFPSDLDGDGHLDLIMASSFDNTVSWFRSIDNAERFGDRNVITNTASGVRAVIAFDVRGWQCVCVCMCVCVCVCVCVCLCVCVCVSVCVSE